MLNRSNRDFDHVPYVEITRSKFVSKETSQLLSTNTDVTVATAGVNNNRNQPHEWILLTNENNLLLLQAFGSKRYLCVEPNGAIVLKEISDHLPIESFSWEIHSCGPWVYTIVNRRRNMALTCNVNGLSMRPSNNDNINEIAGNVAAWYMKFQSGEVCHLVHAPTETLLQCPAIRLNKSPVLSKVKGGWESWRLIEAGSNENGDDLFYIASWTHTSVCLGVNPNSTEPPQVQLMDFRDCHMVGQWRTTRAGGEGVYLQSVQANDWYLCTNGTELWLAPPPSDGVLGDEALWQFAPPNQNTFYFRGPAGGYLTSASSTILSVVDTPKLSMVETQKPSKREEFQLTGSDGVFSLQSKFNQNYVAPSANDDNTIQFQTEPYQWMVKEFDLLCRGHVLISTSCEKDARLLVSIDGALALQSIDKPTEDHVWHLHHRLPDSVTASQIATKTALVVGAAALAPYALTTAVGMLGFGSTGIAAGSTAATLMSMEATAMGGGVAAGGFVATLQSWGAVGLGLYATVAAMAFGATVGAGVGAIAATTVLRRAHPQEADAPTQPVNRPFADWRKWANPERVAQ